MDAIPVVTTIARTTCSTSYVHSPFLWSANAFGPYSRSGFLHIRLTATPSEVKCSSLSSLDEIVAS